MNDTDMVAPSDSAVPHGESVPHASIPSAYKPRAVPPGKRVEAGAENPRRRPYVEKIGDTIIEHN
jgi:hypothetical protein